MAELEQERMRELFCLLGVSGHIPSVNVPKLMSGRIRRWLSGLRTATLLIDLGSPGGNGCIETLGRKLPGELLDREILSTPQEAQLLVEPRQPLSSIGNCPPAPEVHSTPSWVSTNHCSGFRTDVDSYARTRGRLSADPTLGVMACLRIVGLE